jgi:TorA maturation chaperone TorD
MAEHQISRKQPEQDEKDAWDAYASAALTTLVTPGSASTDVAALAADYATLLLAERRKAFPPKASVSRSEPLKL